MISSWFYLTWAGIILKANTNLLFWKFDLLQIVLSVNINLSNMASKRQQGPDDESEILKWHIDINTKNTLQDERAEPTERLSHF